jgi:sulfotransferase famil protein
MIISFLHKYIFIAVPKTGTHAVRQALREQMGPDDWEQVGLFVTKTFPVPELAAIRHGHLTLNQVRPHLRPEEFDGFYKFGFVRNPFDRFVSFCSFMTRKEGSFDRNPQGVMHHFLFVDPPRGRIHYQPQHIFFEDAQGRMIADQVGRVEEMQESFDEACRKIGIRSRRLETVNASRRGNYRDYYTPTLKDAVAKLYARDLELFGYEF